MDLHEFWMVWSLYAVGQTVVHARRCCPPGFKLNSSLSCADGNSAQVQGDLAATNLKLVNINELCVPRMPIEVYLENFTQAGLPPCRRVQVFCSVTASSSADFFASTEIGCHEGDCRTKDVCAEEENGVWTALKCACPNNACIRKCCPLGNIYDDIQQTCVQNDTVKDWEPLLLNSSEYTLIPNLLPTKCEFPQMLKIPYDFNVHSHCFSPLALQERNTYDFNSDGSVQVKKYKVAIPIEAYCGEHTLHENGLLIQNNLIICLPQSVSERPPKFDIYGVLLILGGCFLLVTVAVSCYLPQLRGTLYHKVTICHNLALMVASFTWGIANVLPAISYSTCVTLSLVIQLTFLASFFWMNVMCIDIALAFKNLRSVYGPAVDKSWGSLLWYSLYAWGCPILLTGITAAMELSPNLPNYIVRPGFGCSKNCGFNPDNLAILIYFYGPMIFILIFNSVLFIMTLLKIRAVEKQTAILKSNGQLRKSVRNHPEIKKVLLFSKMFVLMGLTWGTEVIGWCVGGPAVLWYLPDLINFLRAVFICFLFVGKRSVLLALKQNLLGNNDQGENRESRSRRSQTCSTEKKENAEIERRGRILARQITQTITRPRSDTQL